MRELDLRDHETCVPHEHVEPDAAKWARDQAAALRRAARECGICGDYTSQGVEVHSVCLDKLSRGHGPFVEVPEPTPMPFWSMVLWRANNALGHRFWQVLPYRLRHRWAWAWIAAGSPRPFARFDTRAEWQRGYVDGIAAGKANMESKWAGNLTGTGPYANYPPPRRRTPVSPELAALLFEDERSGPETEETP